MDSPPLDRVQDTGNIETGLPAHELKLPKSWKIERRYSTYATTSPNIDRLSAMLHALCDFFCKGRRVIPVDGVP